MVAHICNPNTPISIPPMGGGDRSPSKLTAQLAWHTLYNQQKSCFKQGWTPVVCNGFIGAKACLHSDTSMCTYICKYVFLKSLGQSLEFTAFVLLHTVDITHCEPTEGKTIALHSQPFRQNGLDKKCALGSSSYTVLTYRARG